MDPILAQSHIEILHELRFANDRIASLEADVDVYRMGWQQAIHALHDVTTERDMLRKANRRIHEERRQAINVNNLERATAA